MRALFVVVFAACASPPLVDEPTVEAVPTDDAGEPLPSAGTATLRPGTVVLPASATKDAIVELGHVMFPAAGNDALLALQRGNVIVSGSGDGFIRRVYSVAREGEAIRVITSPATLADAVTDAAFHMTVGEPLAIDPHHDGRLEDLTATIDGALQITPTIDLDFALGADGVEAFDLRVTGTGTTSVAGTIVFTSPNHRAWGEERQWDTVLFRRAFAIGPVPIVVAGRLTTTLAASAYVEQPVTFTSGAHADLAIDASSSFTPAGGWTMTDASHVEVTQIGPVHDGEGRASLAVGVDPRVQLVFYGAAGPTLHLVAQAGGFGAYCGPSLLTGLQAAMQGSVTFDLEALAKSTKADITLWDKRQFLDEIEQCAP